MAWGMFVYGDALGMTDHHGWLASFNLEEPDGYKVATFTNDSSKAIRFETMQAVLDTWKMASRTIPLRPDGRPNRPLSAYTIEPRRLL